MSDSSKASADAISKATDAAEAVEKARVQQLEEVINRAVDEIKKHGSTFSNREITSMFDGHEKLDVQRFGEMARQSIELRRDLLDPDAGFLPRIEKQTKYTNGHVADAFKEIAANRDEFNKWRWMMLGGLSVISAILIPIGFMLLQWALHK